MPQARKNLTTNNVTKGSDKRAAPLSTLALLDLIYHPVRLNGVTHTSKDVKPSYAPKASKQPPNGPQSDHERLFAEIKQIAQGKVYPNNANVKPVFGPTRADIEKAHADARKRLQVTSAAGNSGSESGAFHSGFSKGVRDYVNDGTENLSNILTPYMPRTGLLGYYWPKLEADMLSGILTTPLQIAAEIDTDFDPAESLENKIRATGNILLQVAPVEKWIGGGLKWGAKSAGAGLERSLRPLWERALVTAARGETSLLTELVGTLHGMGIDPSRAITSNTPPVIATILNPPWHGEQLGAVRAPESHALQARHQEQSHIKSGDNRSVPRVAPKETNEAIKQARADLNSRLDNYQKLIRRSGGRAGTSPLIDPIVVAHLWRLAYLYAESGIKSSDEISNLMSKQYFWAKSQLPQIAQKAFNYYHSGRPYEATKVGGNPYFAEKEDFLKFANQKSGAINANVIFYDTSRYGEVPVNKRISVLGTGGYDAALRSEQYGRVGTSVSKPGPATAIMNSVKRGGGSKLTFISSLSPAALESSGHSSLYIQGAIEDLVRSGHLSEREAIKEANELFGKQKMGAIKHISDLHRVLADATFDDRRSFASKMLGKKRSAKLGIPDKSSFHAAVGNPDLPSQTGKLIGVSYLDPHAWAVDLGFDPNYAHAQAGVGLGYVKPLDVRELYGSSGRNGSGNYRSLQLQGPGLSLNVPMSFWERLIVPHAERGYWNVPDYHPTERPGTEIKNLMQIIEGQLLRR